MTVMPGSRWESPTSWAATRSVLKTQAPARLQELLEAGYTKLMSGGGPVPGIVQLTEMIEKGQLKGPRIVTSVARRSDTFKTEAEARAVGSGSPRRA